MDISIPVPTYESKYNRELEILPSNYEEIIEDNGLSLSKQDIREILLNGNITLEKPLEYIPPQNTPLFLSTENIEQYFLNHIAIADRNITIKINKELDSISNDINQRAFLLLPFVDQKERNKIKNIYTHKIDTERYLYDEALSKLLSLSNDKEKFISLVLLKNTFNTDIKEEKDLEISNRIYLEENKEYYMSLLQYVIKRREIFQSLDVYNNEYEEIIDDINRVINKDNQIYSKIYNLNGKYLLLHTTEDNILTVGTTDSYIEYTANSSEYDIQPIVQSSGTIRLPVLMYHQIDNAPEGSTNFVKGLYLSPLEFEKQIAYLIKKEYETVSIQQFLDILKSEEIQNTKSILLTFDDGTPSHYTKAYKILKKYNLKGTFFVVSGKLRISKTEIKEMSDNGMDIQSHTVLHQDLVKLQEMEGIQSEIGGSKIAIENITGKQVISIAYPGCVADSRAFTTAKNNGYELGFSCGKSIDHRYSNSMSISRVHNPRNIDDLKKILSGIYPF